MKLGPRTFAAFTISRQIQESPYLTGVCVDDMTIGQILVFII